MDKIVDFKTMIQQLEDKKWEILLKKGDLQASKEWPEIEKKLIKLYRWWGKDFGANIRPYMPRKFK